MKTTGAKRATLVLALGLWAAGAETTRATIDANLNVGLAAYIIGAPSTLDQKAEYALAVLKLWGSRSPAERAAAQGFIDELCNAANPVATTGSDDTIDIWFHLPQLARMLVDPTMEPNLTATNKANIRRVMWEFISQVVVQVGKIDRCSLTKANGHVWATGFGENKSVIEKATCLLGSMALAPAGDGYDGNLADGGSIESHARAWKNHFYEYFRQRAREGLMCEIATHYNNITAGVWSIVRDMAETGIDPDPELLILADKAITLFWADYVTDFVPSLRIRAIAGSRYYKSSVDAVGADPFRRLTFAYEWHPQSVPPGPLLSTWMASGYRPPFVGMEDILKNVATDIDRPSYASTSRRLGRGVPGGTLQFGPNHASDVRRDMWYTRNYALGGLTLKTDGTPYMDSGGPSHDRLVGLVFANPAEAAGRIVFYGSGDPTGDDTTPGNPLAWVGKREINSVSGPGCLVAGLDPQSTHLPNSPHNLVKLFISNGQLLGNLEEDSGWLFTRTTGPHDDVFVGIRICEDEYTPITTIGSNGQPSGQALLFDDRTSPVVIEVATSAEFEGETGFAWFKAAAIANWNQHQGVFGHPAYDPATNKVHYHSFAGDQYEFWSNSALLPRKNGADVNLNPAKTYESPYMDGDHGRDVVTVGDGTNTMTLDFNFVSVPRRDDYQTVALWHMDAIAAGKVVDDDTEVVNRNRDLTLVNLPTVDTDAVSNGWYRTTAFGKSLRLNLNPDGTVVANPTSYAKAGNWPALDNMVIDFWFKSARDGNQTLASASNIWEVRLEGTNVRFFIWDTNNAVRSRTVAGIGTKDVWHHVHAEVSNVSGRMSLNVDGVSDGPSTGNNMKTDGSRALEVGFKTGTTRYFAGRIDDMKIRRWSDQ